MTGGELIQFIQKNRLEDFEISLCNEDQQLMFGDYIRLDGKKELAYYVGYPMTEDAADDIMGVIEVFDENAESWKWTHPTTDEALVLRNLEP